MLVCAAPWRFAGIVLLCAACGGDDGGGSGTSAPIPIGGATTTGGTMAGVTPTGGTLAGTTMPTGGAMATGGTTPTGGTMPTGGTGAPAPTYAPTFTAIFEEILTNGSVGNCMFGVCHGGPPNPMVNGGLQIKYDDKDGAYNNMVGVVSTSPMCSGKTIVVAGDAASSLLTQKISATPPCGMRMPIGAPLSDAHIQQITEWINKGAPND